MRPIWRAGRPTSRTPMCRRRRRLSCRWCRRCGRARPVRPRPLQLAAAKKEADEETREEELNRRRKTAAPVPAMEAMTREELSSAGPLAAAGGRCRSRCPPAFRPGAQALLDRGIFSPQLVHGAPLSGAETAGRGLIGPDAGGHPGRISGRTRRPRRCSSTPTPRLNVQKGGHATMPSRFPRQPSNPHN
jgi:hypothetical protein